MHRPLPRHALLVLLAAGAGCAKRLDRTVTPPEQAATLDQRAPYLKVHTGTGRVYVLSPWRYRPDVTLVEGTGVLLDANRDTVSQGPFTIPLDSVVLFETNVARTHGAIAGLAVLTGISAGVTMFCIANPKACFGSCPTFYASDGTRDLLQAEGFSASIAPSLEATDVDHLYRVPATGGAVNIRMVNEALETHVVRFVRLLAVPRPPGSRVFAGTDGRFWLATDIAEPTACRAPEGDCLSRIGTFDGRERTSAADSTDLAAREEIELVFPPLPGPAGLVLASRQSLLPTYLLYQAFAWMGRSAGQWLARLERGGPATSDRLRAVARALGGIEVLVPSGDAWVPVDTVIETGPLAADTRVIPLPGGAERVRLRGARGGWRIDWVARATLADAVTPVRVAPAGVVRDGREDTSALERLRDSVGTLVTLPGDEYTLRFVLPTGSETELFLESRGYYLEWMRDEWMAEENPTRLAQLFLDPGAALRDLAPAFSRAEPDLERAFWRSKYVRQ